MSVNRSWTGFTVEDYKKASQSVYSDQNSIQDIEESKEEKKDGGFDLSGYEIVRAQFFSTRLNPAMTISEGRITFNTACLKKFEDVEYPKDWDFKICSIQMLRMIWRVCEWNENDTYRIAGTHYPEYNLVEFNLNQARMVRFGEIE